MEINHYQGFNVVADEIKKITAYLERFFAHH